MWSDEEGMEELRMKEGTVQGLLTPDVCIVIVLQHLGHLRTPSNTLPPRQAHSLPPFTVHLLKLHNR